MFIISHLKEDETHITIAKIRSFILVPNLLVFNQLKNYVLDLLTGSGPRALFYEAQIAPRVSF